jgi:hypothetical protein
MHTIRNPSAGDRSKRGVRHDRDMEGFFSFHAEISFA